MCCRVLFGPVLSGLVLSSEAGSALQVMRGSVVLCSVVQGKVMFPILLKSGNIK